MPDVFQTFFAADRPAITNVSSLSHMVEMQVSEYSVALYDGNEMGPLFVDYRVVSATPSHIVHRFRAVSAEDTDL